MAERETADTEALATTRLLEARTYLRDFDQRHDPTNMEEQQLLREIREHVGALERVAGEWVRASVPSLLLRAIHHSFSKYTIHSSLRRVRACIDTNTHMIVMV